jgi:hypothetical protein
VTWRRRSASSDGPFTLRQTRAVEVEDVTSALAAAEYSSIRAESLQSFATSQSIIQWSLATYGVLFGAGLLATGSDVVSDLVAASSWMAAIIYGLLLPGLICAAAWSWIGEIRRMERSGAYLRGLERRIRGQTALSKSSVVAPINWESFLAGSTHPDSPAVKGWAPYIGTSLLFGGAGLSSVVFFYFWIDRIIKNDGPSVAAWLLIGVSTSVALLFLAVCLHMGLGVVALGGSYFDFETGKLRVTREPLPGYIEPGLFVVVGATLAVAALLLLPDSVLSWRDALLASLGIRGV